MEYYNIKMDILRLYLEPNSVSKFILANRVWF